LHAAGGPQDYNDPSNWTVHQEWDSRNGDLAGIIAAFTFPRSQNLAWSPDGVFLTMGGSSDDTMVSFTCSTPFDPNTATATRTRSFSNPNGVKFGNGDHFYFIHTVGDEISQYLSGSGGYWIGSGAELSDITKANVGFSGSTDGPMTFAHDNTYFLWMGDSVAGLVLKVIDIPGGDLDAFSVFDTAAYPHGVSTVLPLSPLSADGLNWYNTGGSQGVRLLTLQGFKDPANSVAGSYTAYADMGSPVIDIRPEHIWIDPFDTAQVWVIDDEGANEIQIGCINTNV
jgi:hypothetical protein